MLRCKLTAVGIEDNYVIVNAQNSKILKKLLSESMGTQMRSQASIVTT